MEMEPVQMQNKKTSTGFLKRDAYLENKRFLLNLSDIEVYFLQNRKHSKQNLSQKEYQYL